jgi:hypothetical protein
VSDIRRDRLRQLAEEAGGQSALAQRIDKDRRQVSAWLTDPAKPGAKGMSDETARHIEARCLKPSGWLDHSSDENGVKFGLESGSGSQPVRTDPARMADAIYFLEVLAELQGVPGLVRDPVALCIAYDFLEECDQPTEPGNVLDITKRLAAKIRGNNDGEGGNTA